MKVAQIIPSKFRKNKCSTTHLSSKTSCLA